VYSKQDNLLHSRKVETGLANWKLTEVVSGLTEGEQVVSTIDRNGVEDGALAKIE
jgi:HlyD family secretion protein